MLFGIGNLHKKIQPPILNRSRENHIYPIALRMDEKTQKIKLDNLKMLQVLRALIVPLEEQISALKESVHFRKITK